MNSWNLKITQLKEKNIFQTSIFGFHVNFAGCNAYIPGMLADSKLLIPKLMVGTLDFMIRNFISCISWYIYIYMYIHIYIYMIYPPIFPHQQQPHPFYSHPSPYPPCVQVSLAELKILCPGCVLKTLSSHSWIAIVRPDPTLQGNGLTIHIFPT